MSVEVKNSRKHEDILNVWQKMNLLGQYVRRSDHRMTSAERDNRRREGGRTGKVPVGG